MLSSNMYVDNNNHVHDENDVDLGPAYYMESVSHDVSERNYKNNLETSVGTVYMQDVSDQTSFNDMISKL